MADELKVSIEKLIYGGNGLAHADGNTVFVPYVLPGEEVRATTKSKKKRLIWAELLEVTSPAKDREKAKCAHFQKCGGCHYQHILARNALAAWRNCLGWRDRGAFGGALWLSKPRAMGSAKRDASGAGIFPAGELHNRAD